jgi:hypothetical protein
MGHPDSVVWYGPFAVYFPPFAMRLRRMGHPGSVVWYGPCAVFTCHLRVAKDGVPGPNGL